MSKIDIKKKVIFMTIFMLFFSFFSFSSLIIAQEKPAVAIAGFKNRSTYDLPAVRNHALTKILNTALVETQKWNVKSLNEVNKKYKETDLKQSDIIENFRNSLKMGELLHVEYIITGSILNISLTEESADLKVGDGEIKEKYSECEVVTNIDVNNIKAKETIWSKTYTEKLTYKDKAKSSIKVDNATRTIFHKKISPKFKQDMLDTLDFKRSEEALKEYTIEFFSNPQGAKVTIDDTLIGYTPIEKNLEEGRYTVKITKQGYRTWQENINIVDSKVVKANLNSTDGTVQTEQEKTTVKFTSKPSGASIELDGFYIGNTPLEKKIETGIHKVNISLGGFETWNQKIKITSPMEVHANLGVKDKEDN